MGVTGAVMIYLLANLLCVSERISKNWSEFDAAMDD